MMEFPKESGVYGVDAACPMARIEAMAAVLNEPIPTVCASDFAELSVVVEKTDDGFKMDAAANGYAITRAVIGTVTVDALIEAIRWCRSALSQKHVHSDDDLNDALATIATRINSGLPAAFQTEKALISLYKHGAYVVAQATKDNGGRLSLATQQTATPGLLRAMLHRMHIELAARNGAKKTRLRGL